MGWTLARCLLANVQRVCISVLAVLGHYALLAPLMAFSRFWLGFGGGEVLSICTILIFYCAFYSLLGDGLAR
jgi:hypothetical protein